MMKKILMFIVSSSILYGADRDEPISEDRMIYLREKAKLGDVGSVQTLLEQGTNLRNHFFVALSRDLKNSRDQLKTQNQKDDRLKNIEMSIKVLEEGIKKRQPLTQERITTLKEKAKLGDVEAVETLLEQGTSLRDHFFAALLGDLKNSLDELRSQKSIEKDDRLKNTETSIRLLEEGIKKRQKDFQEHQKDLKCREWSNKLEEFVKKGDADSVRLSLTEDECLFLLPQVIQTIRNFVIEQKEVGKLLEGSDKFNKIKACVELLQDKQRQLSRSTFEYVRSHSFKK